MFYSLVIAGVVLFLYIYIFAVQRPYLYFKSADITRFFERCKTPTSTVWPTPFLALYRTGILQTLFGATFRGQDSPLDGVLHERVNLPKRDEVTLDWLSPSDGQGIGVLVLLNHGYGGRLVNGLIRDIALKGKCMQHMHVVIVSILGIESLSLNWTSVLQLAVTEIEGRVGVNLPKTLIAFSLGGIPAVKFALHLQQQNPTQAFAAIALVSLPLEDVVKGSMARSNVASNLMLGFGKEIIKDYADIATTKWPELVTKAIDSVTLAEFHNKFIAVSFDQGAGENNLIINLVDQLTSPCVLFYALDDPFIDFSSSVDLVRLIRKPEIVTVVTEQGGHCGFFVGLRGVDRWISDYALDFITSAITPSI